MNIKVEFILISKHKCNLQIVQIVKLLKTFSSLLAYLDNFTSFS